MEGQGLIILLYSPAQEEPTEEYLGKLVLSKSPDGPDLSHFTSRKTLDKAFSASLMP